VALPLEVSACRAISSSVPLDTLGRGVSTEAWTLPAKQDRAHSVGRMVLHGLDRPDRVADRQQQRLARRSICCPAGVQPLSQSWPEAEN
jgi:hypothetical protein